MHKTSLGGILLLVSLASVPATTARAQVPVSGGLKAGIDLANLGADAEAALETDLKSKLGFAAGAYLGFDLHENFRLQIEGQYVQKGAKSEVEGVDVKVKLDYFEFMVPLTVMIPTEGQVSPRLYAGPALGIEVTCKISGSEGGVSIDVDCAEGEAETKSIDFGVFFGGGLDIAVGAGAITLDVLYNLGLTNINDDPDAPDEKVTNRNLQALVGYKIFFGASRSAR